MKDVNILINNGVNVKQSLELFGDMQMYDETLNDFLDLIDEKLSNLEKFKAINDMQNYAIEVHALKSDARYLGFVKLGDLAYAAELKSKASDAAGVDELHPQILDCANEMIHIAKNYLGLESSHNVNNPIVNIEDEDKKEENNENTNVEHELMAQAIVYQSTKTNTKPSTSLGPKQGTILVVEDSNIVANFVKKIFDVNYDVIIASDGAKAIELVDDPNFRSKIKACLLDLNMPNVDGFAVLEHFKQNNYFVRVPVAVVSGVEDISSLEKANTYPIVDILSKPFNERDVKTVVDKCLATYF